MLEYSKAVPVTAAAAVLGVVLGALYFTHSRWATLAMAVAVVVAGALFIRLLGVAEGALVLLITTCLLDQWTFSTGRLNLRPEQVALAIVAVVLVVARWRDGRGFDMRPNLPEALLLAWFAVGLASSAIAAQDRFESLKILALLVISSLALFVPRRLIGDERPLLDRVIAWLLLGFALESTYALATYYLHLLGPTVALTLNPASGHLDAMGTMWEPNVLGAVAGAGAIAWLVLGSRHFGHSWIGVALCLTAAVASFTRAAWIAVVIVLIISVATPVRRLVDLRAMASGILATLLLVASVLASDRIGQYNPGRNGGSAATAVSDPTDILGRLAQFGPVFHDLLESKLRLVIGGGIDSYSQRHVLAGVPQHLANLEVTVLNDTGFLGMALFAAFVVSIVVVAWRMRHDRTVVGLGGMMLVLAITNTATQTLELMVTWLLIGLLLSATQVAEHAVSVPANAGRARDSAA